MFNFVCGHEGFTKNQNIILRPIWALGTTIVVTTSFKLVIALGKKISTCWAKNRTSQLQQGPEKNGLKMPNMENVQKLALAGQNKEALWGISTCWPNKCTTTIYNCNMMPKRFTKMPQNAEKSRKMLKNVENQSGGGPSLVLEYILPTKNN